MSKIKSVDAKTAKKWLDNKEAIIVDVREPHEYAVSHLAGAVRIGVDEVASRSEELRTVGPIIVYCRSGMRSARARDVLRNHGIAAVSLAGGLLAWRRDIDPQLPVA